MKSYKFEFMCALTPEKIKELYEKNPNTNAFTDSDKESLDNLKDNALVKIEQTLTELEQDQVKENLNIIKEIYLTQVEYDALVTKDPNVKYLIFEDGVEPFNLKTSDGESYKTSDNQYYSLEGSDYIGKYTGPEIDARLAKSGTIDVTELSAATELKNEAQFVIEQDGLDKSVSGEQIKEFIIPTSDRVKNRNIDGIVLNNVVGIFDDNLNGAIKHCFLEKNDDDASALPTDCVVSYLQNNTSGSVRSLFRISPTSDKNVSVFQNTDYTTHKQGVQVLKLSSDPSNVYGLKGAYSLTIEIDWDKVGISNIASNINVVEFDNMLDVPLFGSLEEVNRWINDKNKEPSPEIQLGEVNPSDDEFVKSIILFTESEGYNNVEQVMYLQYLQNDIDRHRTLIYFGDINGDPITQFLDESEETGGRYSGIQEVIVKRYSYTDVIFKAIIDFDKLPKTLTPYAKDAYPFDVSKIPYKYNKDVFPRLNNVEKYLDTKEQMFVAGLPINVFGEVVPESVKTKIRDNKEDVLICLTGDSLTGAISGCEVTENPEHLPPGMTNKHFHYFIWKSLCKNKPYCNRLDSIREGVNFYTTTGEFTKQSGGRFDNTPSVYMGEYSTSDMTYGSQNVDASVSFIFDANLYDKFSIVWAAHLDGSDAELIVAQGGNKLLVSIDRKNWVEANGYTHSQKTNPTNLPVQDLYDTGTAVHQRHRKLWFKKVEGVTEALNITYRKNTASANSSDYLYFWGTEMWNQCSVFIDNIGRGGRPTRLLQYNISDVFDRKPDFVIYEMPVANELSADINTTNAEYTSYFNSEAINSFKVLSNNYEDVPALVLLPHGRGLYFDAENQAVLYSSQSEGDYLAYLKYKMILSNIKKQAEGNNLKFVNLYDQLLHEATYREMSYLYAFSKNDGSFCNDSVHLNERGAALYAKYLVPLFE